MLNNIFLKKRYDYLKEKKVLYSNKLSLNDQNLIQLNKFNKIWINSCRNIPFYNDWKIQNSLPDRINDFEELYNFPILTNEDIRKNSEQILKNENKNTLISTGGSTGSPVLFPASLQNINDFYSNIFIGRGWWNIYPDDKMLLIWGHSHLFGTGLRGVLNEYKRKLKDYFSNKIRLNAYDMSENNIKNIYHTINMFKPHVIVGYTSSLIKLSEFIINHDYHINNKFKFKAVIPTAETISNNDIFMLEKAFSCPVVIEYGMAETGVIAYSYKKTNNLKIFWNSFICSSVKNELIITTLDREQFPLINYGTKDIIETDNENYMNIKGINKILGRKKDFYELRNLRKKTNYVMSGIFIVHAIKNYNNVLSVQVKKIKDNKLCIYVVSNIKINIEDLKNFFFNQLVNDFTHADRDAFEFRQIKEPFKSNSGKVNLTLD